MRGWQSGFFAAALAGALAWPVAAQAPVLAMLGQIQPGLWELRLREPGGSTQRLCLRDGRRLIQLRHAANNCDRLIVTDAPGEVAVQYTCTGHGYGLTRIRKETPRLMQLESQGVADGLPFDFEAEVRRIGDCPGG